MPGRESVLGALRKGGLHDLTMAQVAEICGLPIAGVGRGFGEIATHITSQEL